MSIAHSLPRRRGATLTDVLVTTLVVVMLLAIAAPSLTKVNRDAGQMQSASNLMTLASAHAMYSADWDDRQVTWVPDELGTFGGSPQLYFASLGVCPSPMVLGFSANGGQWGYWLPCSLGTGNWSSFVVCPPNAWNLSGNGSFRLCNAANFNTYIDGRFYSPVHYSPNDTVPWYKASAAFDLPDQFIVAPGPLSNIVHSTYALSPAAMWSPKVHESGPGGTAKWLNPNALPDGYASPPVSAALHPDLKTRMIEHNWTIGAPGPTNPDFGGQVPYFFNHGLDASPLTLFFDGHVQPLSNAQVVADDLAVQWGGKPAGLWNRVTPFGNAGYYGNQSYDGVLVSHHMFTVEGILGRDTLSVSGIHGGVAGAPRDRQRPIPRPAPARDRMSESLGPLRLVTPLPHLVD